MSELLVIRDLFVPADEAKEGFTLGTIYAGNQLLGYTLEDEDRHLEEHGMKGKVYGRTAIPCGRYRVVLDWSQHFGKEMPHILGVPTHDGIRIHGANHAEQLLGCVAVGQVRTADGVATCDVVQRRVVDVLKRDAASNQETWITVRRA